MQRMSYLYFSLFCCLLLLSGCGSDCRHRRETSASGSPGSPNGPYTEQKFETSNVEEKSPTQEGKPKSNPAQQEEAKEKQKEISGMVTLYAFDELKDSFGFRKATYGKVAQDGDIYNSDSDIRVDYRANMILEAGVQGGEKGVILDLGKAFAYHAITVKGGKLLHQQERYRKESLIELKEIAEALYNPDSTRRVKVNLGHVYLVRIYNDRDKDILVKLKVIAFPSGDQFTFRWEILGRLTPTAGRVER